MCVESAVRPRGARVILGDEFESGQYRGVDGDRCGAANELDKVYDMGQDEAFQLSVPLIPEAERFLKTGGV